MDVLNDNGALRCANQSVNLTSILKYDMVAMGSLITAANLTVYSTACSGYHLTRHHFWPFVRGVSDLRWMISPHKEPVMRKAFPGRDVDMQKDVNFLCITCQTVFYHCTVKTLLPQAAQPMRQWTGSALVQVMAWRHFGIKPLPEAMLTYCQFDPQEQTSVKYQSKFKYFLWRKCVWFSHKMATILSCSAICILRKSNMNYTKVCRRSMLVVDDPVPIWHQCMGNHHDDKGWPVRL